VTPSASPDSTARPRAAVVYNPAKVNLERLRRIVADAEARASHDESLWFPTAAEDDGAQAATDAAAAGASVVIVVGGDGTVRAVAERLADSPVPLAVAAAGTGNLLARALKLPLNDLPAAIDAAFTGTARPLDLGHAKLRHDDGRVTSHTFLVMAGIGLDARMAADTNPELKKRVGWLAYAHPISRSIISGADFALHYRLDGGRRQSTRAHTVIVGNCGTLTGGVLLIPDAQPDDGVLDTVILRPRARGGWLQIGVRLMFARFLHRTTSGKMLRQLLRTPYALRYGRARHLEAVFNTPQEFELDGDSYGAVSAVDITVRPSALQLVR